MKPSGNKPSQINAHIYLGSKDHAKSLPLIKSLGITHILNCTPTRTIDPGTFVKIKNKKEFNVNNLEFIII